MLRSSFTMAQLSLRMLMLPFIQALGCSMKMEVDHLPNIPGIRRHPVQQRRASPPKPQPVQHDIASNARTCLELFSNTAHEKQAEKYTDLSGRYSMRRMKEDCKNQVKNLPFGKEPQRLPRYLEFDKKVLLFHAWFKELVPESPVETERVHKCDIYYHLEDGTMQVVEHKQMNSGLPQGDLIKRLPIAKPDGTGKYTDKDLYIGAEVELFGKVFMIVDANTSTRKHMAEVLGMGVPGQPSPYPEDSYTSYLTTKMQRETGADTTVPRNRRMYPMKEYMESILGKPVKMQDLGRFLSHDKKVLRFFAVWDDRESLYGDLLHFKVHYYLVDDSIEIVPIYNRNSGRDKVGKLLSRNKLVKDEAGGAGRGEQCYHWKDLTIGSKIKVFGRELLVLDADPFTREYVASHGQPLSDKLVLPDEPVPKYARPIPPHTGYGSEEDTLKNCFSFDPKPPLKDGAKAILNSGKILRYGAKILTPQKDDRSRYFVIMYYMEDDTIAIREPPTRNSGFTGGNFLARTKVMKNTEERYEPYDLYVGATVQMVAHKFEIIDADDYTLNYMESHSHEGWHRSNIYKLLDKLRACVAQLRSAIVRLDHPTGKVSYDNMKEALQACGLELGKQEEITLFRALDPFRKGLIPSYRLIKKLEGPAAS